jgi:hypothetical protein
MKFTQLEIVLLMLQLGELEDYTILILMCGNRMRIAQLDAANDDMEIIGLH